MSAVTSAGAAALSPDAPLSIAYLTYRGKPHVGGQGVYTRHLTKALVDLGHTVEVFGGQPYPVLDERIELHQLPSLDLWNDHFPGRFPGYWELKTKADWAEAFSHLRGTFGEPLAFSMRALQALKSRQARLRSGARQPVPRLQHPRHREADPHHRHAAPSDHARSRAGDGAHHHMAQALLDRPLVQLREDAGPRRQPHAAHRRGQRELHQGHPLRHGRQPRSHATGAGRCRPRVVHAAPADRSQARSADHHGVGRRRAEGSVVPARGDGQVAHRARRHA